MSKHPHRSPRLRKYDALASPSRVYLYAGSSPILHSGRRHPHSTGAADKLGDFSHLSLSRWSHPTRTSSGLISTARVLTHPEGVFGRVIYPRGRPLVRRITFCASPLQWMDINQRRPIIIGKCIGWNPTRMWGCMMKLVYLCHRSFRTNAIYWKAELNVSNRNARKGMKSNHNGKINLNL